VEKFDPAISGNRIRQQYGLARDDLVLFFMGWLYHFSGLKEVALELARNPDPKLKFLILGEGDAYEELQKIREAHHLQDKVILTGKRPYQEIPEYIAAADVCLLPAYTWEPIMRDIVPIKMYEYMAMQKPVISTRLPGVMKEFEEGNGVVYVDKPEEAVGKALELVRTGQARELGLKARKFVERNSWDKITDEFELILNEVIAEKKAQRP
jgi:glycosyltransferase involved in cell wall biosynthesis